MTPLMNRPFFVEQCTPSPLVGEGWGEGAYKIKCEGPLVRAFYFYRTQAHR